ncbi:hypothetical protein ACFXGR_06250 [Streptomyces mirabilis]|uniref:hypothetical protein n=1 Tax=Streptomyces mirabilis TaxID=68239 RepID=UPI00367446A9
MVEQLGGPGDDRFTAPGFLDAHHVPDLLEPGPYGEVGECLHQQVDPPDRLLRVEPFPGDHGRDLHDGLAVTQDAVEDRPHLLDRPGIRL